MTHHDTYSDSSLRDILARVGTIALLGASDDPSRPSYQVMRFLVERGYRVFAVNPKLTGPEVAGARVCASLADVPEPIDMVDVFRNNAAIPAIVDEVLALSPRPSVIWLQIGVRVDAAAEKAEAAGLDVVMDRCPKIEVPRLFGSARKSSR